MAIVLDAGGLIAIDRADRGIGALLRVAHTQHIPVRTSAAVVAQVWRAGARQANLARVLAGIAVFPIDQSTGRQIGDLLGRNGTSDVIDGHVALISQTADTVVTSDVDDLEKLVEARGIRAVIDRV